ncbi:hypothetical protein SLEP1_g40132 [Rubroshorea leprosula]|uniref:Uncharacterized protein n=1 Tax=Rubroshorea leprosula TaxID=152421 RepID=A0AAV5L2X2_9ROSI|nr:hypothetical protein SLEP1_g40132 [Rubroshorea leprosula]
MAYYQKDDLRRLADEGFQDIEEQFGRTIRCNPLQDRQQLGPQRVTVLWKPGFSSTSATYFNDRVPPQKEAGNPRSNLLQATQAHGGLNSYQEPAAIRAKESVIKTSGGWYVFRLPQVPTGKRDAITSDQAAKNYGGYLIRDY